MKSNSMEKFNELINQGVERADQMRQKQSTVSEIQRAMSAYSKEVNLPKAAKDALDAYPEKRFELQRKIIAFMGEGKHLQDSLIR